MIAAAMMVAAMPVFTRFPQPEEHSVERTIRVGALERRYLLHVPPSLAVDKPAALVLAFHGGGSHPVQMERFTGFSPLSDREGFIVAYPAGLDQQWNDHREAANIKPQREGVDDLAFVTALLDVLAKDYRIDAKRIFATGASNGGMFSHLVGAALSDRVCAIAPVIGGMAPAVAAGFKPGRPVSVLMINGTEDPLVPFGGGEIGGKLLKGRGSIVSTAEAVKKWAGHNGCAAPVVEHLPDKDPKDGTHVTRATHAKGRDGAEVVVYTVHGGGHTWPGGAQYLPERAIGRVCRDFDATTAIWKFFKAHPRP